MIKLFQKTETYKYIMIKILFIKITFKKKSPKSYIDAIVWWIPFKSLRNAVRNIYCDLNNKVENMYNIVYETKKELLISNQLYSKLSENIFDNLNNQLLVSVIIPVYNIGEKYLRHCLESIINQSYKNIEIIIVNDGSAFESDEKIILEYASKDNRIKYIKHKKNMGMGIARMTGLKEAKGYSVLFMDGDDYAALNLLEVTMSEMVKNNVDIVWYNFFAVKIENNKIEFDTFFKNIPYQVLYGKDIMSVFLDNNVSWIVWNLWNKLFKRDLLLELGFDNMPAKYNGEDLSYCFKAFLKAKSLMYIPLNLYFYIINRDNSQVNHNRFEESFFTDIYYICVDMFDYLNKKSNEEITILFCKNFLHLYYSALDFDKSKVREEKYFINLFKKVILDLIDYGAIDKNRLLENVKNITNDKNLIAWLIGIL